MISFFSPPLNDNLSASPTSSSMGVVKGDESSGGGFYNPVEGPAMFFIGGLGLFCNLVCLAALTHKLELKLSSDYLFLLRSQSIFDLLYLLTSTPCTALPYLYQIFGPSFHPFFLPYIFPFVQITMIASIYITIALAVERYLSIRDINITRSFPCKTVVCVITIFSFLLNMPRFFELRVVKDEKTTLKSINNTGVIELDWAIQTMVHYQVKPTASFYTVGYFLGYNMIGSFLVSLFIPVVILVIFNSLIWRRLQAIWNNQSRLGIREKRNTRAALSLVLVVVLFVVCHSMKLVVSGYQVSFQI